LSEREAPKTPKAPKIPPEIEDLAEVARRESLEELTYNVQVKRTRPYSRIAAICRERFVTLEEVCSKGPREPPYTEIGTLYSYARPFCRKVVTVYRGGSEIRPGDWVALEREYAEAHGTPVYELKVPASDVVWAGTDVKEWFYIPKRIQGLFSSVEEFWRAAKSTTATRIAETAKNPEEEIPEVVRVPTLRPARQKVLTEFIKR
jgi:8-oxo-dGTP pyrophosphatase MutT (NUDIX family)